jgi:ketosteroid isomerase-like protein
MTRVSLLIILIALTVVATQRQGQKSPIAEMVETERAFARTSKEKGTTLSFLDFIADDGVLFRPKAVKGKQWLSANPPPVTAKRPWLHWAPSYAFMAKAGDMGYTFGPWEYRSDVKDKAAVAFGHFLTVWKKQADGTWKFAVDLGVSHPDPKTPSPSLRLSDVGPLQRSNTINVAGDSKGLLNRDKQVSKKSLQVGGRNAFEMNSLPDVVLFREGKLPVIGRQFAAAAIIPSGRGWTWTPEFAEVSRSGDLGHSYGIYEIREAGTVKETGNYMRIWKKRFGFWKVAVDLANPIVDGKN